MQVVVVFETAPIWGADKNDVPQCAKTYGAQRFKLYTTRYQKRDTTIAANSAGHGVEQSVQHVQHFCVVTRVQQYFMQ